MRCEGFLHGPIWTCLHISFYAAILLITNIMLDDSTSTNCEGNHQSRRRLLEKITTPILVNRSSIADQYRSFGDASQRLFFTIDWYPQPEEMRSFTRAIEFTMVVWSFLHYRITPLSRILRPWILKLSNPCINVLQTLLINQEKDLLSIISRKIW